MARYYFHLENKIKIVNDEDVFCETLVEARAHARRVACEMGAHKPEQENHLCWIRVTDEAGNEVFRVALTNRKINEGENEH
ncbi:MAG TPA: hypothetical protein VKT73_06355 [Xanthobacteraceae bacterium]|nr:hypothetical protein [Xanthobacteraceae bacterium]